MQVTKEMSNQLRMRCREGEIALEMNLQEGGIKSGYYGNSRKCLIRPNGGCEVSMGMRSSRSSEY